MLLSTRPRSPRRGLSLLEVLVALAIFLLSFVAIGRLVTLASDHALDIQQHSQAMRLAQSKLNEVLCGAVALQSGQGQFDEDPDWQWSVDAEENGSVTGLWTVTVNVTRSGDNSDANASATVSQMVLDPSLRGSVFDQTTVTGANDTATSSSSASASGQGASGAGGQQSMAGGAAGGATKGRGATRGGGTTPGRGGGTTTPGRGSGGTTTPGRGGGTTPGRSGGTTPGRSGGTTTPAPTRGGGKGG